MLAQHLPFDAIVCLIPHAGICYVYLLNKDRQQCLLANAPKLCCWLSLLIIIFLVSQDLRGFLFRKLWRRLPSSRPVDLVLVPNGISDVFFWTFAPVKQCMYEWSCECVCLVSFIWEVMHEKLQRIKNHGLLSKLSILIVLYDFCLN